MNKRIIAIITIITVVLNTLSIIVYGYENDENGYNEEFSISITDGKNTIKPFIKNGTYYLIIPKSENLAQLQIDYTGNIETIENAQYDNETKKITGTFQNNTNIIIHTKDGQTNNVVLMQSDVPAIFVDLSDGVTKDVLNSGSKEIKYKAGLNISGANEQYNIIDDSIEIKGRGNTSWSMPKKSYQIKLNKKQNLLGIGKEKNKKWLLIANYSDETLLKNKIINDLCVNSKLSNIPNSTFVDLFINGDYIGNYLLCDKIEANSGRIELNDDNGVLAELDNAYYYDEDYYFKSNVSGIFFAIKELANENNATSAINSFKRSIENFESKIYSGNSTWKEIEKLIDVQSFAKYYLINELSKNTDTYFSSTFFYKDGINDVIHIGPTWDYDKKNFSGNTQVDYTLELDNYMRILYQYPQFANIVNKTYKNDIKELINNVNVNDYANNIKESAKINSIIWNSESTYNRRIFSLNSWIKSRVDYFNDRYINTEYTIGYASHVQDNGWETTKVNGAISGTTGQSKRIEAIRIQLSDLEGRDLPIGYQVHIENYGWTNWKSNGELAGTIGESKRIEAIKIKANDAPNYTIKYRVHVQDYGWSNWCYDGDVAGTTGQSKRIEAIEIQVIDSINKIGSRTINEDALISYKGHIQDIGDTGYMSDGEVLGTSGRALRLEGLQIELGKQLPATIGLGINEHIQDIGWKYGLTNKDFIGTRAQSKRIEALTFKLNGKDSEKYTIKYRVHIQDIGWQNWKLDGQIAGTTGQSKRIEAIQIKIEEK